MINFEMTFDRFLNDFTHRLICYLFPAQARWRVRSFAARWITLMKPHFVGATALMLRPNLAIDHIQIVSKRQPRSFQEMEIESRFLFSIKMYKPRGHEWLGSYTLTLEYYNIIVFKIYNNIR